MNNVIQDEELDRQLRDSAPYIDDDGFTARVMSMLPAYRRESRSLRGIILIGITVLASAVAYTLSGGGQFVNRAIVWLSMLSLPMLLIFVFGCGLVVGGGAVIWAIRRTPEVRDFRRLQS